MENKQGENWVLEVLPAVFLLGPEGQCQGTFSEGSPGQPKAQCGLRSLCGWLPFLTINRYLVSLLLIKLTDFILDSWGHQSQGLLHEM